MRNIMYGPLSLSTLLSFSISKRRRHKQKQKHKSKGISNNGRCFPIYIYSWNKVARWDQGKLFLSLEFSKMSHFSYSPFCGKSKVGNRREREKGPPKMHFPALYIWELQCSGGGAQCSRFPEKKRRNFCNTTSCWCFEEKFRRW